jgi:hypothetical protein
MLQITALVSGRQAAVSSECRRALASAQHVTSSNEHLTKRSPPERPAFVPGWRECS